MREPDAVDWCCGILDVLEAAALHGDLAEIRLDGRWQRVPVVDVVGERGGDWLDNRGWPADRRGGHQDGASRTGLKPAGRIERTKKNGAGCPVFR